MKSKSNPAAPALLALSLVFGAGAMADPAVIKWTFSYTGARVVARGVVETAASPEPDGSYRILSITGKRNGKRIVELLPEGEMLTSDEQFMFSDNRLLSASPHMSEGGFSYRTSDSNYFNVCHAGEGGNCGSDGYREFDGKKGTRAIRFDVTPIDHPAPQTTPAAPDERIASDPG